MKCWHPDVFCAALLNAQPMGFYAPAQIVRDAREHGVEVRPVCVNASRWDCTLEPTDRRGPLRRAARHAHGARSRQRRCGRDRRRARRRAIRLGRRSLAPRRRCRPPRSSGSPKPTRSGRRWGSPGARRCGRSRRCATSRCRCSRPPQPARPDPVPEINEPAVALRPMTAGGEVVEDYGHVGLTLRGHPVVLPARGPRREAHRHLRRGDGRARRPLARGRRPRARPAEAGLAPRASCSSRSRTRPASPISSSGRRCSRQQRRVILSAAHDGGAWPHPARRRGGPSRRAPARRSVGGAWRASASRDIAFPLPHGRGDQVRHGGSGPIRANSRPDACGPAISTTPMATNPLADRGRAIRSGTTGARSCQAASEIERIVIFTRQDAMHALAAVARGRLGGLTSSPRVYV